jgi:hypothetical protein
VFAVNLILAALALASISMSRAASLALLGAGAAVVGWLMAGFTCAKR